MFNRFYRAILICICAVAAVFYYLKEDYGSMTMMLIAAGLFIYGYYRYGNVYIAFKALQIEDYAKAKKLISEIKNPELLVKGQKSYYHFSLGILASNEKKWNVSYNELVEALNIGLRTKNDTSIVLLNLANVEFNRQNFDEAMDFIAQIKEMELNPLVRSEVDKLETEIIEVTKAMKSKPGK